jgi:RimJ/RimL family protein N-acetyltransferase
MSVAALLGSRVSLRVVRNEDSLEIEAWYGEAARAAYEERAIEELRAGSLFAMARPEDDQVIGLLEYRREGEWLDVPFVALAKPYRGWGYGSEAVRLLEEWALRERLAERFRAEVDVRNGLGLYFWLRLGYRPAGRGEFGWPTEESRDMMPMVRERRDVRGKR